MVLCYGNDGVLCACYVRGSVQLVLRLTKNMVCVLTTSKVSKYMLECDVLNSMLGTSVLSILLSVRYLPACKTRGPVLAPMCFKATGITARLQAVFRCHWRSDTWLLACTSTAVYNAQRNDETVPSFLFAAFELGLSRASLTFGSLWDGCRPWAV